MASVRIDIQGRRRYTSFRLAAITLRPSRVRSVDAAIIMPSRLTGFDAIDKGRWNHPGYLDVTGLAFWRKGDGWLNRLQFIIQKVHDGWIVTIDGRKEHSHFNKRKGCMILVKTLCNGKMPKKPYFREAARRILTEDEFGSLIDHQKPHYININKGVVR